MYLQSAEIQNFRGIRHLSVDFERDATVLIGENAWGKSSLLYALFMILGRGEDNLCIFSADDIYVPIKLESDSEAGSNKGADHSLAGDRGGAAGDTLEPQPSGTMAVELTTENRAAHRKKTDSRTGTYDSVQSGDDSSCYDDSYIKSHGLAGVKPLKIINTHNYQRRFYSVPDAECQGRVLHIVDLPRIKHEAGNTGDLRQGILKQVHDLKLPEGLKTKSGKTLETAPFHQQHARFAQALKRFSQPTRSDMPDGNVGAEGGDSAQSCRDNGHSINEAGLLEELRSGVAAEAEYEKNMPLYYRMSRQDRLAQAQASLQEDSGINSEVRSCIQDDLRFVKEDVFREKAERIVIDLIFCESTYGTVNNTRRFEGLKPACYLGSDGLYRIHYRVSAQYQMRSEQSLDSVSCPQPTSFNQTQPVFVTRHELLNEKDQPIANPQAYIRELIILNPLLRIRDRRMLSPSLNEDESFADLTAGQDRAEAVSGADSVGGASGTGGSFTAETGAVHRHVDAGDMRAISHFFADISSDEDLSSRKINDGIDVLNTITSKYLINYQSDVLMPFNNRGNTGKTRTAREIITTPVSIDSLASLKAALMDEKPSRSKFLMSLLAGALLMSKGQREIDAHSRPILILEDIESRFHPTLLLNLWSILQALPIQKIVTTNSSQLVSEISLGSIRRLCKQYYDVRCFKIRDHAFGTDDARKIAFHIRMSRPSVVFARCWILVEGETEVWILNEIASILGINLACNGIKLIEFAQCGLSPLIKLAKQWGIAYHVLTDGDDAGRHYAQNVRDFTFSSRLTDHLSVMPHVDIEHYLYTSGFADVYQKAANIQLRPQSSRKNGTSEKSSLMSVLSSSTISGESHAVDEQYQTLKELKREQIKPDAQKAEQSREKENSKESSGYPERLPQHNLDSVIKTVFQFLSKGDGDYLRNIMSRGKRLNRSKAAVDFDISLLSREDVANMYQYVRSLIFEMPRKGPQLTKKQSNMLTFLKSIRGRLMITVNHNEQMLAKQKRKQQQKGSRNSQVRPQPKQQVKPAVKVSVRPALEDIKEQQEQAQVQAEDLKRLSALAAEDRLSDRGLGTLHSLERTNGKNINAFYGALDDAALQRIGLSVNKVIDSAIHKKTKPGMAILVSEAMQQRGPDSVPVLFRTMFRKISRLAQSNSGLD